jgi:mRNA-degrading endonuclease RelE of RelBE toxin-antitoxin system
VAYRLRYTDEARLALRHVPGNYRQRLRREIETLAITPRPPHALLLDSESPDRYRIRLDRWRLIYGIHDDDSSIRILRIRLKAGPETYEDLEP